MPRECKKIDLDAAKLRGVVKSILANGYGGSQAETMYGHLQKSWSEKSIAAGDDVTLRMVRSESFVPFVLWSWLMFYSTLTGRPEENRKHILDTIEKYRFSWMQTDHNSCALVERIYLQCLQPGHYDCLVLASKVAWLMRPSDVVIYDSQVYRALRNLAYIGIIDPVPKRPAITETAYGKKPEVNVKFYVEIDAIVRTIEDACLDILQKYLDRYKTKLPPDLRRNTLRLLDKILWVAGKNGWEAI